MFFGGCDLSKWRSLGPPPGRCRRRRASTFRVAPGTGLQTVGVTGAGDAPQVKLTSPSGATFDVQLDGTTAFKGALAIRQLVTRHTVVQNADAAPGTRSVQALPGSTPITNVQVAQVLPRPRIAVAVRGRGARGIPRYRIAPQPWD